MKAATWLCPVLTLLCATKLVYTAQRGSYGGYPLDDMDSQLLQNDYFRSKRNKPSLSIVNPLDVLRQRLLLEIARRQMKENSRQVELNRAILKNVGKRMANKYSSPLVAALYDDVHESQQQQQQMQHLQPYDYELIPTTLIFDYLQQQQQQQQQRQQPWLPYESSATPFDNNYINNAFTSSFLDAADETGEENGEQDMMVFNGVLGNNEKHSLKHIKQSNDGHSSPANEPRETLTFEKSINSNSNRNDDTKRLQLINNHQLHHHKNDLNLDLNDANPISSNPNANDFKNEVNDNNGDYQIQRYLYHLHKNQNHLTRK
ncbi:probable serine/threonine-protein kinase dyrk1 [Lucilia cuprina]|uniref:probable serine/threonine-protein kinase dyrk1 n=1 Tax=Lucilia cuprina TaxID=7375 RepID=UPI001F053E32|nr:probable serine/threonine-protein kinase dyrk1 [Lucilia cuprina]XP_046805347.1 probable serine/threonine-protein kinase dyrk1 [Lucilia cuprina]